MDPQQPARTAAAAACENCLARAGCLTYAVAADERWGIWGGYPPDQRRRLADAAA